MLGLRACTTVLGLMVQDGTQDLPMLGEYSTSRAAVWSIITLVNFIRGRMEASQKQDETAD